MAPQAKTPKGPRGKPKAKSTPSRPQSTGLDKAHAAMLEHLDKTKVKGWKEGRQALVRGKKLLEQIVHAETVTEEHVEEWSAFLQNEMAAADGGNAPGIIDLVPPKLLAEWHREALATLRSEVLEPVGGSLQKLEQADPDAVTLNEADLNAEAKCIGALVSALVESAKTIDPDAKFASQYLHTKLWLEVIGEVLDNLYGGRIGGSDAVINTSGLLELIVTDDKIKAGREILFKTKTVWKDLGELLQASRSALLSLNLLRVINILTAGTAQVRTKTLGHIFNGKWPDEVVKDVVARFLKISGGKEGKGSTSALAFMDIINTLFSDDSPACRGCQVTSLRIEGSDELASDKNQRHLKNGSVFAYADQWCIAVNSFDDQGLEVPLTFAFKNMTQFRHDGKGVFTFKATNYPVSLGVKAEQAAEFEAVINKMRPPAAAREGTEEYEEYDAALMEDIVKIAAASEAQHSSSAGVNHPDFVPNSVLEESLMLQKAQTATQPETAETETEPEPKRHQWAKTKTPPPEEDETAGDVPSSDPDDADADTDADREFGTAQITLPNGRKVTYGKKGKAFRPPAPLEKEKENKDKETPAPALSVKKAAPKAAPKTAGKTAGKKATKKAGPEPETKPVEDKEEVQETMATAVFQPASKATPARAAKRKAASEVLVPETLEEDLPEDTASTTTAKPKAAPKPTGSKPAKKPAKPKVKNKFDEMLEEDSDVPIDETLDEPAPRPLLATCPSALSSSPVKVRKSKPVPRAPKATQPPETPLDESVPAFRPYRSAARKANEKNQETARQERLPSPISSPKRGKEEGALESLGHAFEPITPQDAPNKKGTVPAEPVPNDYITPVQHVQTHNARPKAHRTSHALPAEEPDSDISPPPEEDAPQGRTKRASNARVDESPTEGKPKRPTGKKRKAAEGEEETQPPLPWEVQARPGKKPPASKTKASPAKIESKAEPQGSKSQKSEASERAPAPGKFPNLQPAFEVADVFSSRAERHTPEPISMDDITLVPDSSPLPPRIPAKPPTPVPSPPARKEAPAPVAAAASLPKKKGRGKQPRVPKSVPEPEAVEVVEPIHLDEPNRSSSRRKRDTDPEPEPERERDLEVERRPTRRERDSDRGDTERERDGRAPRSPYHPKQERGDRSSDDSFRPDADGERMSTLWSRGAMRTQAPASPARGVKRVVQVVYERSAKKARFSAPPRPATGAVAEVTELLSQFAELVGDMNTKQLEQPSKKFAVAHRRVMESVGVTATKWWNESKAHLEAISASQAPILAMYRGVAGGTANIVAEAASRDDKVRFVLKNCIKDAELPTSLF